MNSGSLLRIALVWMEQPEPRTWWSLQLCFWRGSPPPIEFGFRMNWTQSWPRRNNQKLARLWRCFPSRRSSRSSTTRWRMQRCQQRHRLKIFVNSLMQVSCGPCRSATSGARQMMRRWKPAPFNWVSRAKWRFAGAGLRHRPHRT